MKIQLILNGKKVEADVQPDMMLLDFVREQGMKSVKSDAQCSKPVDGEYHVYQLYEYDKVDSELKKVDIWVTIYE